MGGCEPRSCIGSTGGYSCCSCSSRLLGWLEVCVEGTLQSRVMAAPHACCPLRRCGMGGRGQH
eukprot:scaffold50845_cov19-Tisochrysis_lutea.AAC.2